MHGKRSCQPRPVCLAQCCNMARDVGAASHLRCLAHGKVEGRGCSHHQHAQQRMSRQKQHGALRQARQQVQPFGPHRLCSMQSSGNWWPATAPHAQTLLLGSDDEHAQAPPRCCRGTGTQFDAHELHSHKVARQDRRPLCPQSPVRQRCPDPRPCRLWADGRRAQTPAKLAVVTSQAFHRGGPRRMLS